MRILQLFTIGKGVIVLSYDPSNSNEGRVLTPLER